jgi:hypothetical protein
MMAMMDPKVMTPWMNAMLDPKLMDSMMKMMDPAIMMPWMNAMTDPKMMNAMMGMMDPKMWMPFMTAMTDPKMMNAMMQMASPEMMNQWVGMMTNPQMMDAMMKMMNPALMVQMMNAMSMAMNAMPKMADDMNKAAVGTAGAGASSAAKAAGAARSKRLPPDGGCKEGWRRHLLRFHFLEDVPMLRNTLGNSQQPLCVGLATQFVQAADEGVKRDGKPSQLPSQSLQGAPMPFNIQMPPTRPKEDVARTRCANRSARRRGPISSPA